MIWKTSVELLDADEDTLLADVPIIGGSNYSEEDSDAAAFQVDVPDTVTVPATGDVLVRVTQTAVGDDAPMPFVDYTGRVEVVDKVIAGRTPDRRIVTLKGRDWLAEFDDAPVSPPLGIDSLPAARVVRFDWTHPLLPLDDWTTPVYLGSLFTANIDPFGDPANPPPAAKVGYNPQGWPDVLTGWIWSSEPDENFSHDPDDESYFDLAIDCDAGPLIPVFTADDTGALAVDGVVLDAGVEPPAVQWTQAYASGIGQVTAGTHHVRIRARNTEFDGQAGFYNPGAIACIIYQQLVSTWFEFDNVIARTGLNVGSSNLLEGGGWRCLANPTVPPGFTWGHAFRLLFDQAQSQGHLVGWTLGFNDEVDSNGNPWPLTSEITATVNDTLLAFLRQSHARGFCDFAARPAARLLDAWRWRERGDFWTEPEAPPVWGDENVDEVSGSRRR